ncbi:MAG: topoisomerase DNA-binding C4 zinc finger domain-containing protein [Lachnospiraceae bacterium]|nr:topoisomerase DNA-binding C4 zinc finger domain-containing protein [Lachnospiraceae bacterium]
MLGNTYGNRLTEYLNDYVVFDLETTGTSCYTDRVVEISAIKVINNEIAEEFSSLVNPEQKIPYFASQVNGITDDMVADAPLFEEALQDFLEFIGDLPLVGHNIHCFDMKFIYRDSMEFYGAVPGNDYVDTLYLARMCLPELDHHTLSDLASHYGISTEGAHRALADCRMNRMVYEKLGEHLVSHTLDFPKCPKCGNIMVKRSGKYGSFMGCSGYPNCRHTEKL